MTIEKTLDGNRLTVAPAGRLDSNTTPELEAVLDESLQLLSDRGAMVTDILLDFSGAVCGFAAFLLARALARFVAASRQKKKAAASGE